MVYPCFACIVLVLQQKIKPKNGNSKKYNIFGIVSFSFFEYVLRVLRDRQRGRRKGRGRIEEKEWGLCLLSGSLDINYIDAF